MSLFDRVPEPIFDDKKFSRCGRTLPVTSFYRKNASPDGFQSYCIDCSKAYKSVHRSFDKVNREVFMSRNMYDIMNSLPNMTNKSLKALRKIFLTLVKIIDNRLR